jgi:hypothetical protein
MKRTRKDLFRELADLREQVKAVLRRSIDETRRTDAALRDSERKIEDRFAQLGSFDSEREQAARRFRKMVN